MQSLSCFPLSSNSVCCKHALFEGHKGKDIITGVVLKVVQWLQDKREDANCPLLDVNWFL